MPIISALLSACLTLATPPQVSTASLSRDAASLEQLTRHPGAGVRVVQFSSYDRASSVPNGPGWFGNDDGFGGEATPNFEGIARQPGGDGVGEYVICDVTQPGAIVRTWTAAIEGNVRVTIDGSATPLYEGPAVDFFMHKTTALAKAAGMNAGDIASLAAGFEQRYSDYLPIPFARSCRIVWIGKLDQVHFYHVQVKEFPAGTPVEAFNASKLREALAPAQILAQSAGQAHKTTLETPSPTAIAPGESKELLKFDGPGAITELVARIDPKADPAALRGLLLKISFDGFQSPQIAVPLGDFFGAAPGVVPYSTLPMTVDADGVMSSRFVMPFATSAVVRIENRLSVPASVSLAAARSAYSWDNDSMHFHARWSADHDLLARGGANAQDLPFLSAHGRGMYVGTAVAIMNPCPVPTAGGNWWGEGDEKVFVDDEARPSIFGTGSEDYFNYAWSESDIFQYAYFSQPLCTGPETRGQIVNNRWHILDAIPFDRSISFSMELFAHTPTPHLSYCRTAYWYGVPGSHDDGPPINDSDLRVVPLPAWTIRAAGGATGAEVFEGESAAAPGEGVTVVKDVRYSAGALAQIDAHGAAFRVKLEKAGKKRVVLTCTSGPDAASFSAAIDGVPLTRDGAEVISLQTPYFERLVNVRMDTAELSAGEHTISIKGVSGKVGVDFIWVRPVDR